MLAPLPVIIIVMIIEPILAIGCTLNLRHQYFY